MTNADELVVLLHGIARTRRSMRRMEVVLAGAGYGTLNFAYASRSRGIVLLAGDIAHELARAGAWSGSRRVHFVTHSMGGLVAARYLNDFRASIPVGKMGRVVMLAPPNAGSEVADLLSRFPPYRWFYGPAGQELTTAARSAAIVAPHYELGVIAGSTGWPYLVGQYPDPPGQ